MKKYLFILLLSLLYTISYSQYGSEAISTQKKDGVIYGKVIEKTTKKPLEYSNITLYSIQDSSIIAGGITDIDGNFRIDGIMYGRFYVEIQFIGFGKYTIPEININRQNNIINLGKIEMEMSAEMLGEIEIEARVDRVEYRLDRRVVNVGRDLTAAGGSAVDALENVPGVQTDIDDNVSIRGSENFLVLIDGRPSPIQGSEALQQIPAESIETIEIITNPSAKYDPEGVGGIINVIMKKDRRLGYNAQVSANYGSFNSYGSDFLVNIRRENLNFFIGANYNERINRGIGSEERISFLKNDTTFNTMSNNERQRIRNSGSARIGMDYFINKNDILTITGRYNSFVFGRLLDLETYNFMQDGNNIFNEHYYITDNYFKTKWSYFAGDINYLKKFSDNGHELQVYASYNSNSREQESWFTEQITNSSFIPINDNIIDSTKTINIGGGERITAKLDYEMPLFENAKLETGYQIQLSNSDNDYTYWNYFAIGQTWINDTSRHNPYDFSRNIQSGYLLFSNLSNKFGYMLGIRTEYTDRVFKQTNTLEDWNYNNFDFFPSLHVSYKLPRDMEIMASYSRRLNRPRPWHLNPFDNVIDPNNISRGNPYLEPEYTNSLELNYQKRLNKGFISFETYYRETNNRIERQIIVEPDKPDVFISTSNNIGESLSTGVEMMANIYLTKWWDFNISGSTYYYEIKDINSTITWRTNMSHSFRVPKIGTRIQFSGFYNGPSITSQGHREAMCMFNAAIRQDFLDRNLSINFSIRDIFDTMGHESYNETDKFYSHIIRARKGPTFNISVTYRMNDFQSRRERGIDNGFGVDEDI